jgi:MYXO-CTERM domain-containing protein
MTGNQWIWKAFMVVLLLGVATVVFPVMAQEETTATPPPPPSLNETLTWTLSPTPDEVTEETPEETVEEDLTDEPEETPEETSVTTEDERSGEVQDETLVRIAPGDTLQVTEEAQVYDLSALRNETASGDTTGAVPVIELRAYEDNDPDTGDLRSRVSLGASDTGVELDASDFNGIFGTYYPYDGEAVIDKPITVEGPTDGDETTNATDSASSEEDSGNISRSSDVAANDTSTNETTPETEPPSTTEEDEMTTEIPPEETSSTADMPTFTPMMAVEVETSPTQAAAPAPFLGVMALAAAGLLVMMRRR